MTKQSEIQYVAKIPSVRNVSADAVTSYLFRKPFSDALRAAYILDIGQILRLLPPPPARLLDLGVGSGWTSEMLARCGYSVVGVDIAADLVNMAQTRVADGLDLTFVVSDYEQMAWCDEFDAVFIYDALHHAEDERLVIQQVFKALKPSGGVLVTVEPGVGHSTSAEALDAITNFGTTEKDMPFERQKTLMLDCGFRTVNQYLRISQLPLEPVNNPDGKQRQSAHFSGLSAISEQGHTSVVVATKELAKSRPQEQDSEASGRTTVQTASASPKAKPLKFRLPWARQHTHDSGPGDATPELPTGGISREDVVWTYRVLLDREPASETIVQDALSYGTRRAFVEEVLRSAESQTRNHVQSLSLHSPMLDVEWQTDPITLDALVQHVSATWRTLGRERPHWSVLSSDQFLPENIHASEDAFYASGRGDAESVLATIGRIGRTADEFKTVFEYGCGLGRTTLHLACRFQRILACDISSTHLGMAAAKAQQNGIVNIDFFESRAPDFGMLESFDLWFSRIVLQHNPPPISSMILQRAMGMLSPGGLAVFQIPTYAPGYRFCIAEYIERIQSSRDFEVHLLPQRTIFEIAAESDCFLLEVVEDSAAGWPWHSNSFVFAKKC